MSTATVSGIPLVDRAPQFADRTAILDGDKRYTYQQLLNASGQVAGKLLDGKADLAEGRVCFLVPASFDYAAIQWGIWRAGGQAVPMCIHHPQPELAYVIDDSDPCVVIASPEYEERLRPLAEERGLRFLLSTDLVAPDAEPYEGDLPEVDKDRRALFIYTSGTTGKPKGAVSTHDIIAHQVQSLVKAWQWSKDDHILEILPLHHIHGIVNVTCCGLWSGATVEMMPKFDADDVWQRFIDADGVTLFMAVPTIYARLIKTWEQADEAKQKAMTEAASKLRLMVSGSAALPVPTLDRWRKIGGHTLLERYGMTEIGMGLSNPYDGERRPGHVGSPLPFVEARVVDDQFDDVPDGEQGQILIKGPTVFKEYWRKPDATADSFTKDGWFKTGDMAIREDNIYRILGRASVDIIKTGGFKVSALEIEDVLRTHDAIDEVAVVGVPDEEWGERVSAAVVLKDGKSLELKELRDWAKARLAAYKVPTRLMCIDDLPRNAMGKVTKKQVTKLFQEQVSA